MSKRRKFLLFSTALAIFLLSMFIPIAKETLGYADQLLEGMPGLDISKEAEYSQATILYDVNGNELYQYRSNENIDWATFDEIPQKLKDAFIAIEDRRFYEHPGIDLKRLSKAVIGQLTHTSNEGGSTITQQLIKNTHLSSEVSYKRKLQEIVLALTLEQNMSKDQILEWYMNIIYLGESNYGVKAAARNYFNKSLDELTTRECAMIAGLTQSPNRYNPRANYRDGDMIPTTERTNNVLWAMFDTEKISEEEYELALSEKLVLSEAPIRFKSYPYQDYSNYVIEDVATTLLRLEGTPVNDTTLSQKRDELKNSGYRIETALNPSIQDKVQSAITNYTNYPRTRDGLPVQASTVIIEQKTGRVVALVSGRQESQVIDGFNRAVHSKQPVGSSIKPLSVYGPAIDMGYYPGSTIKDYPERIEGYNTDTGYPGGETNRSMLTIRRALELSHNIPAVRMILQVGLENSGYYMMRNGFNIDELSFSPAGMAMGADCVTTLEMTAGYATIANDGVYITPHPWIRVLDRFGNVVLDETVVIRRQVFSERTAWLVTDMLTTNMTDGLGVHARLSNMSAAGKTGTHENKVVSFGGFTPYYTSFVRISSDSYSDLYGASSYRQATGLWKSYMDPIHAELEDKDLKLHSAEELGIEQYRVCSNTGMLAGPWCPSHLEYATPETAPKEQCNGNHWYAPRPQNEETGYWDENGVFHYFE